MGARRALIGLCFAAATALRLAPAPRVARTRLDAHRYRLYNVAVASDADPGAGAEPSAIHDGLRAAVAKRTKEAAAAKKKAATAPSSIVVVRKSLDARRRLPSPRWVYVVDVETSSPLRETSGSVERVHRATAPAAPAAAPAAAPRSKSAIVVGAGPAGLFAALQLATDGFAVKLLERGERVEDRGRHIGRLIQGRALNEESNFCYGEGGAGTWSDGKLTTRIGRNAADVRRVLRTLVAHGAPRAILAMGSPHLGTDGLVKILKSLRARLEESGVEIRFGTRVAAFLEEGGACVGVRTGGGEILNADAVVVASGHGADDIYEALAVCGAAMEAKPVAVGFRVEHPQSLINRISYGGAAGRVVTGNARTDRANGARNGLPGDGPPLPVASYRLAENDASGRGTYSFCMCPGGQIVPALTRDGLLVVNGMSYSRRHSMFANAALVATVAADDAALEPFGDGPLRVLRFQRSLERAAFLAGGGDLRAPVQRLTDFVEDRGAPAAGRPPPESSYRLGVKEADCRALLPAPLSDAIAAAAAGAFEAAMPGFVCDEGVLHGVEQR